MTINKWPSTYDVIISSVIFPNPQKPQKKDLTFPGPVSDSFPFPVKMSASLAAKTAVFPAYKGPAFPWHPHSQTKVAKPFTSMGN